MTAEIEMTGSKRVQERLRAFFHTLPVEICARLLAAVERAESEGDAMPGGDMVASELRAVVADSRRRSSRPQNAQSHVFALLEPFLIDEDVAEKRPARIDRSSLGRIWMWLERDIAPAVVTACNDAVLKALDGDDNESAVAAARGLHKALVPLMRNALTGVRGDEGALRRLVSQLGGPRVFEDLKDVLIVLENRDTLRLLAERLAGPPRALDEAGIDFLAKSLAPFTRAPALTMPHASALAMSKLAQPWQIARVAIHAAETPEAARIAGTPYAAIIDLLVCDLERLAARAHTARLARGTEQVAACASDFVGFVRALVSDIDLAPDLPWAKRVGVQRSRMAQLLRPELETLPARVRQMLRPRTADPASRGRGTAPDEVAAVEAALDLLNIARNHAAELALNEATLRVMSDLQAFLDSAIEPLIDGLRAASGEDRVLRLQQLDAAVRIARHVLGASHAALIAKSIEVAAAEKSRLLAKAG